jgi:hypothetical protein
MADLIVAGKRLGDAARTRFGEIGSQLGRGTLDPESLTRIEGAKVEQNGDTATVIVPQQARPMAFRRRGGRWQLVIGDIASSDVDVKRQTKLVTELAEAMQASADQIAAGAYKAPEDAILGIQQKLNVVMLGLSHPATTRSATAPGTQPATTRLSS